MTPERLAHITKLATAVAQHRGRTVPAIREGGTFDGRAELKREVPMKITDVDRCRASNGLQQAVYGLVLAYSHNEDKERRTQAAIGLMRTAARDLGFEIVPQDDGK